MALTKAQLIQELVHLDVPNDTPVVKAVGMGFEDICGVRLETIVSSSFKDNNGFSAIVLD